MNNPATAQFKLWIERLYISFYSSLKAGSYDGSFEDFIEHHQTPTPASSEASSFSISMISREESLTTLANSCNQAAVDAFNFYYVNVEEADWGCVRLFSLKQNTGGKQLQFFLVKVSTDGDDGWIEVYQAYNDDDALGGGGRGGGGVTAARTYLELIYWMDNSLDELRGYITNLDNSQYPPSFDISKTKWNTPLPWTTPPLTLTLTPTI
jgi:hypothetical protein